MNYPVRLFSLICAVFAVLALVLTAIFPVNAFAAINATQFQAQLQDEMQKMLRETPSLKMSGKVTVTEENGQFIAVLPTLTMTPPSGMRYVVSAIRLVADDVSSDQLRVRIELPPSMSYYDAGQTQQRGSVTIAAQNITAIWHAKQRHFTDLSGRLDNIVYHDAGRKAVDASRSQAGIAQMTIQAQNGNRPLFTATKVQSITQKQDKIMRSTADQVILGYQFAPQDKLTLPRLLGLVNPVWFLTERKPFSIDVTATNVSHLGVDGKTTAVNNMTTRLQVVPSDKESVIGGRMNMVLQQVSHQPESAFSFILPTRLTLMGSLHDMPVQVLTRPFDLVRDLMVQANTRADISELLWETAGRAQLKGEGWLRVAEDVPLGVVGRFTLQVEDLRVLSAALQKQLALPGTDLKIKTQGFMLLMLLQSFAKSDGNATEIVLDLTQDGQVLVNNQDISALVQQVARKKASR